MNITMNRSELSNAVSRAAGVASASSPVKELSGVLLEADTGALTVTATNLEIALQQRLPCSTAEDGALVVSVSLFNAMLRKLAGESVTLKQPNDGAALLIESGDAAYSIPTLNRKSYPRIDIPFPEDTVTVRGLSTLIRRSVFAASVQDDNPLLQCVHLRFTKDGVVAVACNGPSLIVAKGDPKSTGDVSFLVPARSLERLARISSDKDEYRVGTTGKEIVFSKAGVLFTARLRRESYVDTDRVINSLQPSFTVLTDVTELRKALEAVLSVDHTVCLRFDGKLLAILARGFNGSASTVIGVTALRGTPSGQYWQSGKKLHDCLRVLIGTATLSIAQGGMLTLSTEDATYVQSGTRPPKQESTPKQEKPTKRRKKDAA